MNRAVEKNCAIVTTAGIGSVDVRETSECVNNRYNVDGSLSFAVSVLIRGIGRGLDADVRPVYEPDHVCNTSLSLERFTLEVSLQLDYFFGIR